MKIIKKVINSFWKKNNMSNNALQNIPQNSIMNQNQISSQNAYNTNAQNIGSSIYGGSCVYCGINNANCTCLNKIWYGLRINGNTNLRV